MSIDSELLALRKAIAEGQHTVVEVAERCLARIEAREAEVQALAWIDPEGVREQARRLDRYRLSGRPPGPLHGVPIVLKDIIDVAGWPTANGTVLDEGHIARQDAWLVRQLKQAGALLVGKSACTELAYLAPAATRNPNHLEYSPGGSSSGSAAAVAAGMVPLAVGTQTGGSVIRPASYCGVIGFKPSAGTIGRSGLLRQSPTLDTVGVFADEIDGVALLVDLLSGYDGEDPASTIAPPPRLLDYSQAKPPVTPVLAVLQGNHWMNADTPMQNALDELAALLGPQAKAVDFPFSSDQLRETWRCINLAEMAHCYRGYLERSTEKPELLSTSLREAIAEGRSITAPRYINALESRQRLMPLVDTLFSDCDALLCAAAPGIAPKWSEGNTGDSRFNSVWTLLGLPAITLPLMQDENGLGLGVQLIGRHGEDGRLLRTARWLLAQVQRAGAVD